METQEEKIMEQELTNTPTRIKRIAFMLVFIEVVLSVIFLLLIPSIGLAQGIFLSIALLISASNSIIGIVIAKRGNVERGTYHIVASYFFAVLALVVIFEGLGVFALIALVSITGLLVSSDESQRQATVTIIASAGAGLVAILIDILFAGANFRVPIPAVLSPVIFVLGIVLAGTYLYSIGRQFNNLPLRTKLIITFTLIAVLPLGVIGFLNERSTRNILTQEANEALFAAAQQTTDSIQDFISTNLFAISTEASLPPLVNFLSNGTRTRDQALQTLIALQAKNSVFITSYALISNETGRVLLDTDTNNIGTFVSDESYFTEPLTTGQAAMSDVLISPETGERFLFFSSPVRNEDGEIIGILSLRYNADILQNLVARSNGLVGDESFGVVFDENLIHLAHGIAPETILTAIRPFSPEVSQALVESHRLPDVSDGSEIIDLPDLAHELDLVKESSDGVRFFEAEDIATGDRINQIVGLNLGSPDWILVFFQPQDVFLAPAETQTQNNTLLSIVIGSVVIGLAVAMAQLLAQPITSLRAVAAEVIAGNLNAKAEITTKDEIGDLATTFNSMTAQLSSLVSGLEEQVAERTHDLEERAVQLQTAAEVARDSTQETTINELLSRAVDLISDRFELYHVGIYLVDERSDYAILQAASGESGALMLESEHRIQVGSNNAVGYVTRIGQPRVASDEIETVTLTHHPLLPETRSQMVLPLSIGDRVIGSLDLHSTSPGSLKEDAIPIYQTMADQLAVAIQKTELLTEVGNTLKELETAYGRYTSDAWQSFLQSDQNRKGYRYRQLSVEPIDIASEDVKRAWQAGEIVRRESETNGLPDSGLAVPMKVRGQVVGVLNLSFDGEAVADDTREIIEDLAERLGLVLENARLLENAQQSAERERLTTEISARMRETLDVQTILQNAAQEIRQALNLPEVSIRLANAPELTNGHTKENEVTTAQTDDAKA